MPNYHCLTNHILHKFMSSPAKYLKAGDIIAFRTNQPQAHLLEMFGHVSYNPNDIEKEEYIGQIRDICAEMGFFTISSISPLQGFLCVASCDDYIRKVDISELTEEQRKLVRVD